ncbi:DUF7167 family protein [Xenorhabdus santafensis]|uniref:DUF7167 family protein n=1 Tax=Xenorhabdus santafensis TaxID=2582833 RepID=UPI0029E7F069|nr:hypothetical protein [Xenorhabdus sp. 12]
MVITLRTNKVGSASECPLGYTEEEWNQLSDKEQRDAVLDAFDNYIDYSITAE